MSLLIDDNGVPYIQLGKYQIKLETQELTGELKAKAEQELRETPENVEKGLKELKALISGKEIHIYCKILIKPKFLARWKGKQVTCTINITKIVELPRRFY